MQDKYVDMQDSNGNMQHNYVNMQSNQHYFKEIIGQTMNKKTL